MSRSANSGGYARALPKAFSGIEPHIETAALTALHAVGLGIMIYGQAETVLSQTFHIRIVPREYV